MGRDVGEGGEEGGEGEGGEGEEDRVCRAADEGRGL